MSKLIWQNGPQEVTEVIYDTICGMPIDKAFEVLEQYECKRLIPVDYIKEQIKNWDNINAEVYLRALLYQWEEENE